VRVVRKPVSHFRHRVTTAGRPGRGTPGRPGDRRLVRALRAIRVSSSVMRDSAEPAALRLACPVPEGVFRYVLDVETQKALRLGYSLSLVCLEPDVEDARREGSLAAHIARSVVRDIRRSDLVTTLAPGVVGILLINADPPTLGSIIDRIGITPSRGRPRFVRGGQVISVSGGVSYFPATARSADELWSEARGLMARARHEGGDRLLLPSRPGARG